MSASSGHKVFPIGEFAFNEWHRLNSLYNHVSAAMIVALNRYLLRGDERILRKAIDGAVVEVGARSAATYGVAFHARDYMELSDKMADDLIKIISPPNVRQAVQRILPKRLDLNERIERLKVDGLDLKTAIRIERFRQGNPEKRREAHQMTLDARTRRVNLIARTEVPRIATAVLDKLWLDNLEPESQVVKADRPFILSDLAISGGVIPRYARKYWVTRRDGKVCQYCAPLEGLTTRVGEPFKTIYGTFSGPPIHPQCLPGDTYISASGITGATKREYKGELVRIRTLRGNLLAGTPNHPVLTTRGWVPLGEIKHGDQVISSASAESEVAIANDNQYVTARIEDVAESFFRSSQVATSEVPVSPEDFHGDGSGSKIAIVGSNSLLPGVFDSPAVEHLGKLVFSGAVNSDRGVLLDPLSSGDLPFEAMGTSTYSSVGRTSEGLSLLVGHVGVTCPHGLATPAWVDTSVDEPLADGGPADPEAERDALLTLSGLVAPDDVIDIERNIYSGHVYNLETKAHWYIGSGIVTHNCRCIPVLSARGKRP